MDLGIHTGEGVAGCGGSALRVSINKDTYPTAPAPQGTDCSLYGVLAIRSAFCLLY